VNSAVERSLYFVFAFAVAVALAFAVAVALAVALALPLFYRCFTVVLPLFCSKLTSTQNLSS
jgi:hypothetical protein